MTDIVERLRELAPVTNTETRTAMTEAAAEIERLRTRLEIDPSHPYDGIYARDETIRQQDKQIERLRAGGCARDQGTTQYCAEAAELAAENERLREWNAEIALNAREFAEALREIINFDTDEDISNEECMRDIARAALEGRT